MEIFLYHGKLTILTVEKIIGLIILKRNANIETIKTYILYLEQKLSSVVFFLWYMESILYSVEDLSTNIKPLMHENDKGLFKLNQICSQKL